MSVQLPASSLGAASRVVTDPTFSILISHCSVSLHSQWRDRNQSILVSPATGAAPRPPPPAGGARVTRWNGVSEKLVISAGVTNIMPPRHFIYCCRPTVQSSYFMVYGSPITILWQPPTDKRQLGSIFCDGGEVDTTRALQLLI